MENFFSTETNVRSLGTVTHIRIRQSLLGFYVCFKTTRLVSWYALEFPVPPADLIALSPGYRVPPDLATVPYVPRYSGLCSRRPQRRIECSKRRCRLRDVKCVVASCRNDVMISYKSSHPVGNRTTFQLFIGY